ncbi:MAG: phenylalanine--tRNA ligase subunit alpha, partial [bacterium]|nr:phenylalanine--tRNA ligase subunit alpha [bacterium]
MAKINLKTLENRAQKEIKSAKDLKELDAVLNGYLGKKGELTSVLRSLKDLSKGQKARVGKEANDLKVLIEKEVEEKKKKMGLAGFFGQEQKKEWFDITVPGKKPVLGHLHPLTQTKREVEEIFQSMGFFVAEGPEVESEWYNFDALNIPKDHPARDQWDTFWIREAEGQKPKTKNQKLLLRTHTSPVQIRYMESHKPPLRIIAPGNVFRHEATDASHEFQLSQVEGLMVDREVSAANFKATIKEFFKRFFSVQNGKDVKIRLRPDFFPFTEPSFDVSINCLVCGGKGCPACKNSGWVELAGAGMVHPNVFKNAGLNPKEWKGWAFGFGLERLTMMKYRINDIRLFRLGDLRFLN